MKNCRDHHIDREVFDAEVRRCAAAEARVAELEASEQHWRALYANLLREHDAWARIARDAQKEAEYQRTHRESADSVGEPKPLEFRMSEGDRKEFEAMEQRASDATPCRGCGVRRDKADEWLCLGRKTHDFPCPNEAPPEDARAHYVVQKLLFAMHIYSGYTVESRGPSGCLFDAIRCLEPETHAKLVDGADHGDLIDDDECDPVNGQPVSATVGEPRTDNPMPKEKK